MEEKIKKVSTTKSKSKTNATKKTNSTSKPKNTSSKSKKTNSSIKSNATNSSFVEKDVKTENIIVEKNETPVENTETKKKAFKS